MMPEDVGARSFSLHGGEIKSETNSVSISANDPSCLPLGASECRYRTTSAIDPCHFVQTSAATDRCSNRRPADPHKVSFARELDLAAEENRLRNGAYKSLVTIASKVETLGIRRSCGIHHS